MGVSNTSTAGLKPRRTIKIEKPRSLKLATNGDQNCEYNSIRC